MKPQEPENRDKTKAKKKGKTKGDKNQIKKKAMKRKVKKWKGAEKKIWQKAIKEKEPKIKVLTNELLAFTLSYLMLAPWWYNNPSNLSSRTPPKSSLIVISLSSHYQFILLPHYEPVPLRASVGYVRREWPTTPPMLF
jgi:hypothetical protein